MTSSDVVVWMRRVLKIKKIGHTGTLDPGVAGVLPLCVGKGTRLAEYITAQGKAYFAEVTFGVTTDTQDAFGKEVLQTKPDLKQHDLEPVSYTHLRAHETRHDLVCRLLLEKKKKNISTKKYTSIQ